MKRLLLTLVCLAALVGTHAATTPLYQRADSVRVVQLLQKAATLSPHTCYTLWFARQLRGLPYVAKTLEVNREERLVVNLRQLDCTTYVETVMALALCMKQKAHTFQAFCRNLQRLRYEDGKVAYTRRLHYFTYWIEENVRKGLVTDVQGPTPPFTAVQTVRANYMTTHTRLYPMLAAHPQWMAPLRRMEEAISGRRYRYIPKGQLRNSKLLRRTIHDGDIIVIITSKKGLDTSHLGIAVWHADGLHMLNASQLHRKVVEEPKLLATYMAEHPSQMGIRIVRAK